MTEVGKIIPRKHEFRKQGREVEEGCQELGSEGGNGNMPREESGNAREGERAHWVLHPKGFKDRYF